MSNCFHLAIEGGKLSDTLPFYTDILQCKLGPYEEGKWQDVDFWGNELTLHETTPRLVKSPERGMHAVDMGAVCVPHYGIHLPWNIYENIKKRIETFHFFYDQPYTRFEGQDTQQETFFVEDFNYNMLEIKSIQGTYYNNDTIDNFNNKSYKDERQMELWAT